MGGFMSKLETIKLRKVFTDRRRGDVVALNGVDLWVKDKEFISIVGPSGCGKTTLLQLIAGLESPTSGEVLIDGRKVNGPTPACGVVFQEYALFPWLTLRENVEFGPKVRGVPKRERREIAQRFIELVGLQGFEDHYPHELSGGMKQRGAIARALANDPAVLLMDEPFAAVDAQLREILQQEVLRIWRQTKKTILFVTHNINEAIFLADRLVVLTARPGKVKEVVTVELSRPRQQEMRVSPMFVELERYVRTLVWEEVGKLGGKADGYVRRICSIDR